MAQLEEKRRFLDFQQDLVKELRAQRDRLKADLRQTHENVLQEHQTKVIDVFWIHHMIN